MLNPEEFLSDYGVRALSKEYESNPYTLTLNDTNYSVKYTPAESDSGLLVETATGAVRCGFRSTSLLLIVFNVFSSITARIFGGISYQEAVIILRINCRCLKQETCQDIFNG